MSIKVLAVGKRHEDWVASGIERYSKRLRLPYAVEWFLISHSSLEGLQARQEESTRILARLRPTDHVILLDETGKMLDSPRLASYLDSALATSGDVVFVIGGAYGVTLDVHRRARLVWSLSALVFPHQLVRLILTEQIYRAQEISLGHPYHHQ